MKQNYQNNQNNQKQHRSTIKLDSYSLLICSKYLTSKSDFINVIQVCKQYRETLDKFRFNPIRISSTTLFPLMETQYLYTPYEKKLDDIDRFRHIYYLNYTKYLELKKEIIQNKEYHEFPYIEYDKNDRKIQYGNDYNEEIEIPSIVKRVGKEVFSDYEYSVHFPPNVLELGEYCCLKCSVYSLTIPPTITKIGDGCFASMTNMKEIFLPETIQELPVDCFEKCESLKELTIPSTVTRIMKSCFNNCGLTSIEIPDSVKIIERNAFFRCSNLETVSLSSSIDFLDKATFAVCKKLQSITIPYTVTRIESQCFRKCKQLTQLQLPTNVQFIGYENFMDCISLTSITIPSSIIHIGLDVFRNCSNLSFLGFPNKYYPFQISISDSSLLKRFGLICERITMSECDLSLIEELYETTNDCTLLSISTSVKYLSPRLLPHSFPFLSLPTSIASIPAYSFNEYENLTSIELPSNLTSLPNNAFSQCKQLCKIHLPETLRFIGDYCFLNCYKLSSIEFPSSLNLIGMYCFRNCTSLSSIILPENIDIVGSFCFHGCIQLTQISIPQRFNGIFPFPVSYHEYILFKKCNIHCTDVEFVSTDYCKSKTIPTHLPLKISSRPPEDLRCQTIPENIICIKKDYFLSETITSLTIPTSVTRIGPNCFKNCTCLKELTIPTTVVKIGDHCFDQLVSLTKISMENELYKEVTVSYDAHLRFYANNIEFKSVEYTLSDSSKYGNKPIGFANQIPMLYIDSTASSITLPTTISRLNCNSISESLCPLDNLLDITFPSTISKIPKNALRNVTTLTKVILSNGLKVIGENAFSECKYIQIIHIPTTVTKIKNKCFEGCKMLLEIDLQNVTDVGNYLFYRCNNLTKVVLSTQLKQLTPFMFSNCYSLKTINIPSSLTSIHSTSFFLSPYSFITSIK